MGDANTGPRRGVPIRVLRVDPRYPSRPGIDGTTCVAANEISPQAMEPPRMPGRAIPSRAPDVAGRTRVMPSA